MLCTFKFSYTKIRHTIYLDRVTVTVPQILLRDLFRSRFDLMFRCVQLRYERNTREERCERSIMEIIPGTEWCFYLVFEAMAEREAHLLCLLLNPIGNRLRIMAPSGEANVAVYRLASVYSPPLDSITQF